MVDWQSESDLDSIRNSCDDWNKNPHSIVCERPSRLIIWTTNRPASGSLQRLTKSPDYLPKRSNFRFNWSRKNFSYIFALKNCQTYVCHSKKLPTVRKTNNPQFPVPKVPGEAPTLHAMIPYDVRGQKSKRNWASFNIAVIFIPQCLSSLPMQCARIPFDGQNR